MQKRPLALSDDEIIEVANGVGGRYATDRPWLDLEDTKQQAALVAFQLMVTYKPLVGGTKRSTKGWLGFWIKKRLHDWQRKQKHFHSTQRSRNGYPLFFVEFLPEHHASSLDIGYWFIEELSAYGEKKSVPVRTAQEYTKLSPRELQILQAFADGGNGQSIGANLYIEPETVKTHTKRIRQKLRAHSMPQAVANGFRQGLIS